MHRWGRHAHGLIYQPCEDIRDKPCRTCTYARIKSGTRVRSRATGSTHRGAGRKSDVQAVSGGGYCYRHYLPLIRTAENVRDGEGDGGKVWPVDAFGDQQGSWSSGVAGLIAGRATRHHALTHAIFKIPDTRATIGSLRRREVNQLDPSSPVSRPPPSDPELLRYAPKLSSSP